ncbi:ribonuclease E activity regulator RraA [Bosea sp. AS-1]|jgi:regulator of ribonuclease activity A|uniref:ribonuclease E activity regulator RraA n=1 Tax=Bosea sp. AS-1 TaxID=2015316 RepID=UPI000B7984AD|nr:ribonuclease E activity regulator RraA [Bosea sp. AS-1]
MLIGTADIYDTYPEAVEVCELQFNSYGQRHRFYGPCVCLKTFEDHSPLLKELSNEGQGRVLVVDAGGSKRIGVLGDRLAEIAIANHWAGVVINGVVRDTAGLTKLDIGVKALGATARRGAHAAAGLSGVPVEFGSVRFQPGDWVYADEDSVLVSRSRLDLDAISLPPDQAE